MRTSRRAVVAIVSVLALLLILDTGAWFWITGRILDGWDVWRAQAAGQGVQVRSEPPVRGGWPFAAEVTLGNVAAEGGLFAWRAGAVQLSLSPLHPLSLAISLEGPQSLRLDGLPLIRIASRGLTAAVPLTDPRQVMFEGHSITAELAGGLLEVSVLAGRVDPGGLSVSASHLTVPASGLPFGGAIDRLTAHLRTTIPLAVPSAPLQTAAAAAAAWTRAGGQIVLEDAALIWGPLDAQGHFTAGLDADLQPAGAGTLHMSGYHAAIDALVRAGTIGRNASRVATTILDMMAVSNDPPIVDVPLTLRGGSLSMGAIPLLRIAPISWP